MSEPTTAQSMTYFAACDLDGHPRFIGPTRQTRQEAQDDADTHNANFPGHEATVVS